MNGGGARDYVWRWISLGAFATSAVWFWYVGLQHRFDDIRWIPHYGVVALIGLSAAIVGLVQARTRREPIAVSVVALLINLLLCLVSVFFWPFKTQAE